MKTKVDAIHSSSEIPWGELAAPAQRALSGAGYSHLKDLAQVSESQIKSLHGIGPRALETLKKALQAQGLAFANDR